MPSLNKKPLVRAGPPTGSRYLNGTYIHSLGRYCNPFRLRILAAQAAAGAEERAMTTETEMNVTYQNGWAVPAGWKLVPEKPTYELVSEVGGVRMDEEDFLYEYADHEKIGEICRAVVKYSPPPPKAPDYNPDPFEVSVVGMPEFDALLDHIHEEGTSSEGAVHLANKLVRVAIQSYITHARNAQPAPDVDALVEALEMMVEMVEFGGFGRDAAMDTARAALAAYRKQGGDV